MRVIFTGGRRYRSLSKVREVIRELPSDVVIIHGCARGADSLVEEVAKELGLQTEHFPADWRKYGRAAGPIRNEQMLLSGADLVIAFPGNRGTADMVRRAKKAGVTVREIRGDS